MQIDLFAMDQTAAYPTSLMTTGHHMTTNSTDGEQLLTLCSAMSSASGADACGVLVDAALRLILPRAEQIAALGMASMPPGQVEVDELAQELLLEVAAALPFAPNTSATALMTWLSTTLLDALHEAWRSAVQARRRDVLARRQAAEWALALDRDSWDEGDAVGDVPARPSDVGDGKRGGDLALVLESLDVRQARLLSLRAAGHSWRAIAGVLRISARTAQRRHDRALVAARRAALAMHDRAYEHAA